VGKTSYFRAKCVHILKTVEDTYKVTIDDSEFRIKYNRSGQIPTVVVPQTGTQ